MLKVKSVDKKRYISIILILILVLPGIFITAYAGKNGVYIGSVFFILSGMLGVWEILTSFGFNKYASVITASLIIPFFLLNFKDFKDIALFNNVWNEAESVKLSFSWQPYLIIGIGSFLPVCIEPKIAKEKMGLVLTQLVVMFVLVIAATFLKGLWALNASGIEPAFYFLLIAIISDSLGYFGGKYLGSKLFKGSKLAPKLSPKKTWAGAVIGFIFSFTFAVLFGFYFHIWESIKGIDELEMSFIMAFILSVISPIGDLLFSGIKRKAGIKDFSNLLPGHGGVFDRIDAMSIVTVFGLMTYLIFG